MPLLTAFSYLLPASIQTPTVAVSVNGLVSDATRSPLGSVVICKSKNVSVRSCYSWQPFQNTKQACNFAGGQDLRLRDGTEDLLMIGQLRHRSGKSKEGRVFSGC